MKAFWMILFPLISYSVAAAEVGLRLETERILGSGSGWGAERLLIVCEKGQSICQGKHQHMRGTDPFTLDATEAKKILETFVQKTQTPSAFRYFAGHLPRRKPGIRWKIFDGNTVSEQEATSDWDASTAAVLWLEREMKSVKNAK